MFRKFVYLLALAREKHFGRAAESCHVSQPTLSNAIRQLEEELQVPIVERGQKFEGFTPEGLKVLEYARRIVGERDNLRHELLALAQGVTGHLRLGAIPTALPVVPHVLAPITSRFPHIRSSVASLSSREIQRGLDEFEIDAAITYLDNEPLNNVRTLPLYSERYYLLAQRNQVSEEQIAQGAIPWEKAADLRLCLLTPDMQNRRIADTAFRMTGRAVEPAMETNSIVTLYTIVRADHCASIVPGQLLTVVPPHPDLVALPLVDPDMSYVVGLAHADRDPPPPLARALAVAATDAEIAHRVAIVTADAMIPWRLAIR
ncbi:LysR family transcriptional regulator [Azospirillum sp. TSO35-2]|uniref:LysR family transcriptional regulator n=1 Tax=Azospirillum sp. TSO35-2 TaxID=716796 RepID=UPI000D6080DC|nr:LysR family transcriptional regulator [Azospirillum sp. TSO35-2]PWC33695.1 LysR family transcriptional regulator [Azospirillum sp. TSO35-2]